MVYNKNVAFVPRGGPPKEDLLTTIARGDIAPVYCLHGAERYLLDRCLHAIRTAVTGGAAAACASRSDSMFLVFILSRASSSRN